MTYTSENMPSRFPPAADCLVLIAANARHFRERRGLTQAQLAEAVEIDLRQISRIETARAGDFAVTHFIRLADVLGVRLTDLLRARELPEPKRGRPVTKKTGAR